MSTDTSQCILCGKIYDETGHNCNQTRKARPSAEPPFDADKVNKAVDRERERIVIDWLQWSIHINEDKAQMALTLIAERKAELEKCRGEVRLKENHIKQLNVDVESLTAWVNGQADKIAALESQLKDALFTDRTVSALFRKEEKRANDNLSKLQFEREQNAQLRTLAKELRDALKNVCGLHEQCTCEDCAKMKSSCPTCQSVEKADKILNAKESENE